MIQEKLNNGNWKEGLEDVNNLPDYVLQNKPAAWENLHNRLHKKQRRVGFAWYWTAAACLVIVASIGFLITNKKNNSIVINTPIKIQHEKTIPKQSLSKENTQVKTVSSTSIKEKNFISNIKKSSTEIIHAKEKPANDSIVQTTVINNEIQTLLPDIKDSITQTIIAIIPTQKKMKVVHVNELDNNGDNLNMAQSSGHLPFRLKFFNQNTYTDYTIRPATTTGFNILKLNSSPSN